MRPMTNMIKGAVGFFLINGAAAGDVVWAGNISSCLEENQSCQMEEEKNLPSQFYTAIMVKNQAVDGEKREVSISDQDMTSAIRNALQAGGGVPAHLVDIKTAKGIVILSGTLSNVLAKEKAVRIAETIKGVRAVVDRIQVSPSQPYSDRAIQDNIYSALKVNLVTKDETINVNVSDGVVTVTGNVPDWQTQYLVEQAIKGVKGVKAIETKLRIQPLPVQGDRDIQEAIQKRLKADVWIDESLIDVQVKDGHVTLSGTVRSAAEKTRVDSCAWSIGIKSVDDKALQVKWWTQGPMRRDLSNVHPSDNDLKAAIKDAFLFDPRVFSMNPQVRVEKGVVALTGAVHNLRAKEAAEEDVRNTPGVVRVENYLAIEPHERKSDPDLEKEVNQALLRDPYVEDFDLHVRVDDGKAILTGEVDTPFEKWQIRQLTVSIPGIIEIENRVKVKSSSPDLADQDLIRVIKDRLWWSPYINSYQIQITENNHTITLNGVTDSFFQRKLAEQIAYESGARHVDNHIRLRQGSDFETQS